MPADILQIVVQLGAVGILLVVLWQINVKLDKFIDMTFALINKLIDRIDSVDQQLKK